MASQRPQQTVGNSQKESITVVDGGGGGGIVVQWKKSSSPSLSLFIFCISLLKIAVTLWRTTMMMMKLKMLVCWGLLGYIHNKLIFVEENVSACVGRGGKGGDVITDVCLFCISFSPSETCSSPNSKFITISVATTATNFYLFIFKYWTAYN